MKMKKWLTLALAGAMTLSFAACTPAESGDDDGSKAPGTSTGTDVSHPADSLWNKTFEGVTLKRLLWYEPGDAEKALVDAFEERTAAPSRTLWSILKTTIRRWPIPSRPTTRTISAISTVRSSPPMIIAGSISRLTAI